jgi:hypothetical protein
MKHNQTFDGVTETHSRQHTNVCRARAAKLQHERIQDILKALPFGSHPANRRERRKLERAVMTGKTY